MRSWQSAEVAVLAGGPGEVGETGVVGAGAFGGGGAFGVCGWSVVS